MRDYLEGWKDERECEIPPIRKAGFKEEVLIRSQVPLKRTRMEMRDVKKNLTIIDTTSEMREIDLDRIGKRELLLGEMPNSVRWCLRIRSYPKFRESF